MELKPLPVIILDRERHLKLNLNAMVAFKTATGKDLLKGLSQDDLEISDIRALLWVCLLHEDKTLTIEQVGDMVDLQNISTVSESIFKAFAVSMPDKKGEVIPNP